MHSGAQRRIAVTGGGTAGHILPGVEFLRAYRQEFGAEGFFIGCTSGLESRLVPARGERLAIIPGLPWARQGIAGKLRAMGCLPAGVLAARQILRREQVDLVIGIGGYASFGVCVAAYSLGLPVVIHESNVQPGLANRILANFSTLVCIGFPETTRHIPGRSEVTGVPICAIPARSTGDTPPWRFLVLGGSEGSPVLNRRAPALFGELRRRGMAFSVRHISGFGDSAAVRRAYIEAGVEARVDSFVDDIASVYDGATLAIASAGARTLGELSAAAIPSILVPLPGAANDHQSVNAAAYAARTGATVVPAAEWNAGSLAAHIETIVRDPRELRLRREAAAAWDNGDAAMLVVRACENLLLAPVDMAELYPNAALASRADSSD